MDLAACALLAAAGLSCAASDRPPQLRADTAALDRTSFAAGLDAPLDAATNLLWCASLPIAWQGFEELVGGPVRTVEPSPTVALLDASAWDPEDLDPEAVLARAGLVREGVIGSIQDELRRRGLPRDEGLDRLAADEPQLALVSYARLEKALVFETAFEDLEGSPLEFHYREGATERSASVDAFGLAWYDPDLERHRRIADQVRVHERDGDGAGAGEFVVHLIPEEARDRILLCRVEPRATLGETWAAARELLEQTRPAQLRPHDRLVVPELDLELTHGFDELRGLFLANPGWEEVFLADVRQDLRLRLDEEGMVVRSTAWIAAGATATPQPRRLVFDRPFLLAAIQEGAPQPYLLAWVAHPELLLPQPPR